MIKDLYTIWLIQEKNLPAFENARSQCYWNRDESALNKNKNKYEMLFCRPLIVYEDQYHTIFKVKID